MLTEKMFDKSRIIGTEGRGLHDFDQAIAKMKGVAGSGEA
jgi:hypothetical protein